MYVLMFLGDCLVSWFCAYWSVVRWVCGYPVMRLFGYSGVFGG